VPAQVTSTFDLRAPVSAEAPEFVQNFTAELIADRGNDLPVSAVPVDGTFPTGTTQWEKRNISLEIPVWDPETCIQCGKCVLVCPHAVIRAKVYEDKYLANAPETFKSTAAKWKDFPNYKYTLQVSPEDCTGCTLCVEVCPAKNKRQTGLKAVNMAFQPPLREAESKNWDFFMHLPEMDRQQDQPAAGKGHPAAAPAVRVLGRVRRLRRDAICETDQPVVRRPSDCRERDRLLVHLWRQPADDAVVRELGGAWTGMVKLAL